MQLIIQYLPNFLLIFCRITAFFVVVPVFSTRAIPTQIKIGIAFFVSFITFAFYGMHSQPVTALDVTFMLTIIREVLVGLLLGFIGYLFFTVVQIAGAFIDIQLGLAIANIIDPMTGAQSPITGNFKYMVAMLLFLSLNGHHLLIQAIIESYRWIPLSNDLFAQIVQGHVSDFLLQSFGIVFSLSFQMAAPIIVAMFLTDVSLGVLSRVAPQFNIFVVGLPVKLLVGLLILLLVIPGFYQLYQNLFSAMFEKMQQFVKLISK